MRRPTRVVIFGGCVSRDTIDPCIGSSVELVRYIARQSLLSAGSNASHYFPDLTLASDFQQRMVEADVAGALCDDLRKVEDADLLIWDLNVERQGVWRMPDGSIVTNSTELRGVPSYPGAVAKATHIEFAEDVHLASWSKAAHSFFEFLDSIDLLQKTVVLAPEWATHDEYAEPTGLLSGVDASGYNQLFEPYFTLLEEAGMDLVRVTGTVADSRHKWGPGPFHYTEDVYTKIRQTLWERFE